LRNALGISADADAVFERYSDSAASYVVLDQANTPVYKQLYRAAKAKHKLKLRVTVKTNAPEEGPVEEPQEAPQEEPQEQEKQGPQPASVADDPEEESNQSVEPTDTEREPEQPTIANSTPAIPQDQVNTEPTPKTTRSSLSLKDVLQDTSAVPENTPQYNPSGTTPPSVGGGCPAIRANYAVCCNSCDRTIPDAHYHCSTCDDGDFDLCQDCVGRGVTCKGTNHWLIKRFVKHGIIINSTTERLAPKPKTKALPKQAPVAPERIIPVFNDFLYSSIRTCNCCVQELPEVEFVHCSTCDDYDLCRACFAKNVHGHHPRHAFVPAVEGTRLDPEVARRLAAGRGQAHNAICDGCDNAIKGVRHKCLDCPDWDYCSTCVVNSSFIHPGHRFVPIYEPLEHESFARVRGVNRQVHMGICCDGPLCSGTNANSSYIVGDRYKCAVCNDKDFCASCEASPANRHNRSHPLIKFRSPVRHVSVITTGENVNGRAMPVMGDRQGRRVAGPPTQEMANQNQHSLFAGVQTVVDVQPTEPVNLQKQVKVNLEIAEEKPIAHVEPAPRPDPVAEPDLVATFVRDTVTDGTTFGPDHVFEQTWVLRNSGNVAWPAGCSVKFVGGDYMGHLDSNHPAATKDVESSFESTICYASVQPGEAYPFTVLLRTPHRPGRFVSNWRLATKDGFRFGHRLWCDVVVEKPKVVLPPPTVVEPVKQEEEKEEKEAVVAAPEPEPEHSQMIFPKLEKESPVASVHEEAKTESVSAQEQEDDFEDCEDDEWNEEAAEEGYLTDEEYDILDASDEEFHQK